MRDNERYLAFSPAVPQAFLVHSGEVRPKIVGRGKVTLKNKIFRARCWATLHSILDIICYYKTVIRGQSVTF